jgi:hypothetical protein
MRKIVEPTTGLCYIVASEGTVISAVEGRIYGSEV